ncbi:MAG: hypothetical protein F6K50_24015 [Moorea sp. SIO3I7]|nr:MULTISPECIES: hypothetical protein [Moorena]NEN98465.1 hypothetical protein [Moorena sp. SIO3I7]NEO42800.1 hypothetical protein [Moorena sp. SIO4A3]NEO61935.1 hypothetical protein [Moorena sp. SIO4G2]NEO15072.1 hypothetical protein [Moorena sp. SIO3E8]NEP28709.1 hypothetical protein [Moorena sp. SIO3I6]
MGRWGDGEMGRWGASDICKKEGEVWGVWQVWQVWQVSGTGVGICAVIFP